jgi:hypothetical protein
MAAGLHKAAMSPTQATNLAFLTNPGAFKLNPGV